MIRGVKPTCYIQALFIREDGARFLLGAGNYEFVEKQLMFAGDKITNTTVDVQGNDGVLLAGQKRIAANQTFKGYVGDATNTKLEVKELRRQFIAFFQLNYYYTVVYISPDGGAVKRQRGFLVSAPTVEDLFQIHPQYSVGFNFEDVNYYTYDEDPVTGEEIYGQSATLLLYNAVTGGYEWDNVGMIWDEIGAVSQPGAGGTSWVNINSVVQVYPIWIVTGLADNPRLQNLTTGQTLSYQGRISPGQTLVVDMLAQTAMLDGTNVLANLRGAWVSFTPGRNRINYITDNNNASNSTVRWPEVAF